MSLQRSSKQRESLVVHSKVWKIISNIAEKCGKEKLRVKL